MLTDDDVMTFGAHKGVKLIKVPASYLLDLYTNGQAPTNLRGYIKRNMVALRAEAKRAASLAVGQCRARSRR